MAEDLVIAHLDFDGNTIAEFPNPAGLKWSYSTGATGFGKLEYSLAESDPGVTRDAFGPKRTDVVLRDSINNLWEGFFWSYNFRLSEETINIAANDWLQWLDQPPLGIWDYDTSIDGLIVPVGDPQTSVEEFVKIFFPWYAGHVTLSALIETLIEPLQANPAEQIPLTRSYSGSAFGEDITGYLERSPELNVLDMVRTLAQMGAPLGFDFWAEAYRTLKFVGPRRTDPSSVTPIYGFYGPEDIVDAEFTNNGPIATEILFGEGGGNTKRYYHKEHQASIDQYRRWGANVTLEGGAQSTFQVGGLTAQDYKAQAAQNRMMFPQRELLLTVLPDAGFGFENKIMEAVDIDYEKYPGSFHRIDSFWWITSQTYYMSEEGNLAGRWLCDLTLDQINVPIS